MLSAPPKPRPSAYQRGLDVDGAERRPGRAPAPRRAAQTVSTRRFSLVESASVVVLVYTVATLVEVLLVQEL